MKKRINILKMKSKLFTIVFGLIATMNLFAQGPVFDDNVQDVNGIPLDGGLSLLVAGAAAYGIKKLRENKNE